MRIAICDDHADFVQLIKGLVEDFVAVNRYSAEIFTFNSGEDLLNSNAAAYNIVFLDVLMGATNGMSTAKKLREINKNAILIFVSAFVEYAPKGFEVNAFRYLLKQDLPHSFNNCIKDAYNQALKLLQTFSLKTTDGEIKTVKLSEILYFESFDHNVILHLLNSSYKAYTRLSDIKAQLHSDDFIRAHKSYIINVRSIKALKGNIVYFENGENVMCSRTMRKAVLARFLEIQGE